MPRTGKTRVLSALTLASLWLAGAGSGFAADAPATSAKSPETPAATDKTVVLDDTTRWRQLQVAGTSHLRDANSNLVRCTVVYRDCQMNRA